VEDAGQILYEGMALTGPPEIATRIKEKTSFIKKGLFGKRKAQKKSHFMA